MPQALHRHMQATIRTPLSFRLIQTSGGALLLTLGAFSSAADMMLEGSATDTIIKCFVYAMNQRILVLVPDWPCPCWLIVVVVMGMERTRACFWASLNLAPRNFSKF
jgi:hypothetical protein